MAEVFTWLESEEALAELRAWSLVLPAGLPAIEGGLLPTCESLEELDFINVTLLVQEEEVEAPHGEQSEELEG